MANGSKLILKLTTIICKQKGLNLPATISPLSEFLRTLYPLNSFRQILIDLQNSCPVLIHWKMSMSVWYWFQAKIWNVITYVSYDSVAICDTFCCWCLLLLMNYQTSIKYIHDKSDVLLLQFWIRVIEK